MSPIGGLMVWLIVLGAIVLVGPHPGPVFSTVAVLALFLATISQFFGGEPVRGRAGGRAGRRAGRSRARKIRVRDLRTGALVNADLTKRVLWPAGAPIEVDGRQMIVNHTSVSRGLRLGGRSVIRRTVTVWVRENAEAAIGGGRR